MRILLATAVALALAGSTALATELNVSVQNAADGSNIANVAPGETVNYQVVGQLSDTANEGLALFGFDLEYTCGDMTQATAPAVLVENCETPGGITNPAGFGGTLDVPGREGKLVQVGCGQNTIKNTADNADFPTGSVITLVGHSEVVLATGSVVAPAEGPCEIILTNLFANVIRDEETGEVYFATDQANPGTITNLTINVSDCIVEATSPSDCATDARQPSEPDGTNEAGLDAIDFTFSAGCDVGSMTTSDFTISVTGGTAPVISDLTVVDRTVTLYLDRVVPAGEWTCVDHARGSMCAGWLPGDVNASRTSNSEDIQKAVDNLDEVVNPPYPMQQCDVDRSGLCGSGDILRVIDLLNGADLYDVWANQSLPLLPACPSTP